MDRDSDESMAPALHTIEHESATTAIKNLKLSPSAIRLDSNVFDQVNGGFSPFAVKDEINATDFMKNPNQRFNLAQYQTPPKSTFPNKGCSGDVASVVSKNIDSREITPASTFSRLGAGDACTRVGANGWQAAHKNNEKGRNTDDIQSPAATLLCISPTSSDAPSDTPSSRVHCHNEHSNTFNLSRASASPGRTKAADVLTPAKHDDDELNITARQESDSSAVEGLACTLVSSFLSVDECNAVSAPLNSTAITTTAALKSALKTTSSTALTSSTIAVTAVIATSVNANNGRNSSETDSHTTTSSIHKRKDTLPLQAVSPTDKETENNRMSHSLNSRSEKLEIVRQTKVKGEDASITNSCNQPPSKVTDLPAERPASANQGADSLESNAAKFDIVPFQVTMPNLNDERTSKTVHVTGGIETVQQSFEHIGQHNEDEVQLRALKCNAVDVNLKSSAIALDALNVLTQSDQTDANLRTLPLTNSVINATINNELVSCLTEPVSSTESDHTTVSHSSCLNSSTSASIVNQSTNVSNVFPSNTASTAHECDTISTTNNFPPNSEKCLNKVPDLIGLAQNIIAGNHMQNLSLKVTNTLQEFAASVTRNYKKDKESTEILSNNVCEKDPSSTRNLDFKHLKKAPVFGRISNVKELCAQQTSQHEDVLKCTIGLENRIHLLRQRLNKLRAAGMARHARNQLSLLGKRGRLRFSASSASYKSQFGNFHEDKFSFPNCNSTVKSDLMPFDTTMRHQPGVQSSGNHTTHIGILEKDLRRMRVVVDPDLTDESSDEEPIEEPTKNFPENTERSNNSDFSSLPIQKTALWTWAHGRTSVGHRWTWLDAQVTGLEFKIQHQSELHRQLRTAKEKVVLEQQPNGHKPRTDPTKNHQDCRILDNGDKVSRTTLPYNPEARETNKQNSNSLEKDELTDANLSTTDQKHSTAARTRPLKCRIRHRRLVRASDVSLLSDKKSKPPTVRNECAIMERKFSKHTPFHRGDGKSRGIVHSSASSRATHHDHSYHKILSASEDVSISTRLNGFMMTNNLRFAHNLKKSESTAEKRRKLKEKEAKRRENCLADKIKPRPGSATVVLERADKLMRSVSALQRNTSVDDRSSHDHRRRRSLAQTVSDYNKRHRAMSVDSDSESSHHRSESGTPVFDLSASHSNNPHYQAVLKRKRATDQAFDINNIVIPHGLTAARIEKLQYKEILTPGWRTAKNSEQNQVMNTSEEAEDLTNDSYQIRHDRYEILEKKKYMAYVEWNITKKNGTRSMSRANLSLDEEASSFFYPSLRSSPTTPFSPTEFTFPATPDVAPASPAMVRSRRSSSDQSLYSNSSIHPMERRRLPDSISSDDAQLLHRENSNYDSWEKRSFPLGKDDMDELHKEPIVCLKKLPKDFEPNSNFRPITAHNNVDTNTAPKHKIPRMNDHPVTKRPRTNSHTSVMSRDDNRHSDDSTTSSVSNRRGRQTRASMLQTMSPVTTSTHSYPKRYKSTQKDDFYYYNESDLDSSNESSSDEESLISDDDKPTFKSSMSSSGQWVAKPVSRESTPLRGSTSGDEYSLVGQTSPNQKAPPLVLKIKKK